MDYRDTEEATEGLTTRDPDNSTYDNSTAVVFNLDDYLAESLGEKNNGLGFAVLLSLLYLTIFITGMVGNVCTCIVIAKNKAMHTATNYYLFSLAISDVTSLFLALPPELYTIWEAYPWRFGEPFCILRVFIMEMTAYASVLTITAFTIERYIAICHPIRSQILSTLSRAVNIIVVIWVLACGCALPYPIYTRLHPFVTHPRTGEPLEDSYLCSIPPRWIDQMKFMFQISTFSFFVAPMTIITIVYTVIGIRLRRSDGLVELANKTGPSNTASKARRAVIKMLVAVVVAFFFCWAPYHTQRLMTVYMEQDQWTPRLLSIQTCLFYISGVLFFLSSTVNPILYNLMSRRYRQAFKRTICGCRGSRTNGESNTRSSGLYMSRAFMSQYTSLRGQGLARSTSARNSVRNSRL